MCSRADDPTYYTEPAQARRTARSAVLHGTLTGELWQPGITGELDVVIDLKWEAQRFVNATGSGMCDAIRAAVDGAGDFRCARLTPDSVVILERATWNGRQMVTRSRYVQLAELPSLAGYVAASERAGAHL